MELKPAPTIWDETRLLLLVSSARWMQNNIATAQQKYFHDKQIPFIYCPFLENSAVHWETNENKAITLHYIYISRHINGVETRPQLYI